MRQFRFFGVRSCALLGLAVLASAFGASAVQAAELSADGVWREIPESAIARTPNARQIVPLRYRSMVLNRGRLEAALARAPAERPGAMRTSTAQISLPLSDGRFGTFRIVESPIMAPGLAQRFPQIRT